MSGLIFAAMTFFYCMQTTAQAEPLKCSRILRFNSDKSFKIVQFTDVQDNENIDPRTVSLIETVLDREKPDLVVFTGDNIARGCDSPEEVQVAIDNFASPVNERQIPWLITFNNHDEDSTPKSGLDKEAMLEIYRSYSCNINVPSPKGVKGTGNMQTLILKSKGAQPAFNIWALDSGRLAPAKIAGQSLADDTRLPEWRTKLPKWDWIRFSQVKWYMDTSVRLEKKYHRKIPSLAFFHIPLWEFYYMWESAKNHDVRGEKNENVGPGAFNSGLFTAMLERGDVKGIFVGHDHNNTFDGNYFGIRLGYAGSTGFSAYGLNGVERNRLRGARVFILNEDTPEQFETHMVFAEELGIR